MGGIESLNPFRKKEQPRANEKTEPQKKIQEETPEERKARLLEQRMALEKRWKELERVAGNLFDNKLESVHPQNKSEWYERQKKLSQYLRVGGQLLSGTDMTEWLRSYYGNETADSFKNKKLELLEAEIALTAEEKKLLKEEQGVSKKQAADMFKGI